MRFTKVVIALFLAFFSTGIPLISQDIGLLRNPEYYIITPCYNNRCLVQDNSRKWHIIDLSDDSSVPLDIDRLINFQDGMIVYRRDKRYGMMTLDQEHVIENADSLSWFSEGKAFMKQGQRRIYIGADGNTLFSDLDILKGYEFNDGYAVIQNYVGRERRRGVINDKGEIIIEPQYKQLGDYSDEFFFLE